VGEHVQVDAVRALVFHEMPHEQTERLAPEPLAPERGLADADPDLGALRLRLPVAVVRLPDRSTLELDREEHALPRCEAVHPLVSRVDVSPPARRASPLEPGEVSIVAPAHERAGVVMGHRPQRDARPAQDGPVVDGHQAMPSATDASRCATKSAGSAFVSRSATSRWVNASAATPRSSSREPRRRTERTFASASLSPMTSV